MASVLRFLSVILAIVLVEAQKPHVSCTRKFKKVGCFDENKDFVQLFTDRELGSPVQIDWKNWESYMHSLACRCNEEAVMKGYDYFSLRYFGLCFGTSQKHFSGSVSGVKCIGPAYQPCNDVLRSECVGASGGDYIYEVGRDGGYSNWTVSACTATCGEGTKTRHRTCTNPLPSGYGGNCVKLGPSSESVSCNKGPCRVDGGWSTWSEFSSCSKTCGHGSMTRHRKCNSPAPSYGGINCEGASNETNPCFVKFCPIDGSWSNWSAFGLCSKSCGVGSKARHRQCNSPPPSHEGRNCSGASKQTESCNLRLCPVDGRWSPWSAFGSCSKSCGGGNMVRHRQCNNPSPGHGGRSCEGASSEMRSCNNDLCPGPAGAAKAQEIVESFLTGFFNSTFPTKVPSGKFHKAIFAVQKAVANEFAFGTTKENLQKRLDDLRRFLKVATEGGNIDFARSALGKSLYVFMKQKIDEGLPLGDITKGARNYLHTIKREIGDKKFSDMMLLDGGATLMFTVDTTGSMRQEIAAAKGIANAVIHMARKFPVDYVLSPFNDPGYGPITHKNDSNRDEFLTAISSLRIFGGRDCPEVAFAGMLEAFKANPQLGSPMFVFTDASAKDDTVENIEKLKSLSDQYGCSINFFTSQTGCGDSKGINSYKEMATYTTGQIFPLKTHAEIVSFTNYVKTSLKPGLTIASGAFKIAYGRKKRSSLNEHELYVDSSEGTLLVTLEVLAPNTVQEVTLRDPSGLPHSAESTTTYGLVFNLEKPVVGKWKLSVPYYAGDYRYVAKILTDRTIDFAPYFLHQEQTDGPVLSISNPLSGPTSSLALQVSGIDLADRTSLRVSTVKENAEVIQNGIHLSNIGGTNGILTAKIKTPTGKFKVILTGTTKKGNKFQRLSHVGFEKTDAVMVSMNAGVEYTVSTGKGSARINIYVFNQGSSQMFTNSATADQGRVVADASTMHLEQGKNSTVSFTYFPPSNAASMIGKLVTVTVVAIGQASHGRIQTEVTMLIVP